MKCTILTIAKWSVALSVLTLGYQHHHPPSKFHRHLKLKRCTHFPYPHPLATATLLSDSMNLTILGTSYAWSHALLVLSCFC
jgi:hypothetical protein